MDLSLLSSKEGLCGFDWKFTFVNELGGQYEETFNDVKMVEHIHSSSSQGHYEVAYFKLATRARCIKLTCIPK